MACLGRGYKSGSAELACPLRRRVRSVAANLSLAAASLIAFALLAEIVLQVILPLVYRPRFTRIDAVLGWYHNRSVSAVSEIEGHRYFESYNSHGYRSPEHPYEKPKGVTRIVVLGDSFVDGSEVGDEELLTWHLQNALPGTEVINLGVYGYSTAQELLTLEHVALRYVPDLVVLVTMTNDFVGNGLNFSFFGPAPRFTLEVDSPRLEPTDGSAARAVFRATNLPAPGMSFLHQHSLVYYFLNHYLYQRLISGRITRLLEEQKRVLTASEQRDLYRRLVQRMKRVCDERAIDFVVVFAYERYELVKDRYSPNVDLRRALQADGIPTIDLFEELREAEMRGGASLYYRKDIHWNAVGHRVVAELLKTRLGPWMSSRWDRTKGRGRASFGSGLDR